jgi:uncharacterized membrane protein
MNLHPIFVHFPIALLTLYSIAEFLRFKKLNGRPWWFYFKTIVVVIGELGAIAALITGDTAKQAYRGNQVARHIISVHSDWAVITSVIYGVVALAYFLVFLEREGFFGFLRKKLQTDPQENSYARILSVFSLTTAFAARALESWIMIPLALLGFIAVTITGALGGSVVYGSQTDIFTQFVAHLFLGQ